MECSNEIYEINNLSEYYSINFKCLLRNDNFFKENILQKIRNPFPMIGSVFLMRTPIVIVNFPQLPHFCRNFSLIFCRNFSLSPL